MKVIPPYFVDVAVFFVTIWEFEFHCSFVAFRILYKIVYSVSNYFNRQFSHVNLSLVVGLGSLPIQKE